MMTTSSELVESKLRDFILSEFLDGDDSSELTSDTALISSGVLNSLGLVKLRAFIAHEFGVELASADATAENLDTMRAMTTLIVGRLGGDE